MTDTAAITKKLIVQRQNGKNIERLIANFDKTPKGRIKKEYITTKQKVLVELWDAFDKLHTELIQTIDESEQVSFKYFSEEHYDHYFEVMIESRGRMAAKLGTLTEEEQGETDVAEPNLINNISLTPISIPIFNGDYSKWREFDNLFKALVHTKKILSIQKFHYLKTHLGGEAAALIRNLELSANNYSIAYDTLKQRYENPRLLVNAQLKTLVSQPNLNSESSNGIKRLLDTTTECLNSLQSLSIDTESWDPIIIFLMVQKLDETSFRLWEQSLANPKELPTIVQFSTFLENRFQSLEMLGAYRPKNLNRDQQKPQSNNSSGNNKSLKNYSSTTSSQCNYCLGDHSIFKCSKFLQLEETKRLDWARQASRCINCLKTGHSTSRCTSKNKCSVCKKSHHSLLHLKTTPQPKTSSKPSSSSLHCDTDSSIATTAAQQSSSSFHCDTESNTGTTSAQSSSSSFHCGTDSNTVTNAAQQTINETQVLLATALVSVEDSTGVFHTLRALLDQGSQATFITEGAAERLKLSRKHSTTQVSGIGGSKGGMAKGMVKLVLHPLQKSTFKITAEALILPKLTNLLPSRRFSANLWNHLYGLVLADPFYNQPGSIDIILGAEVYANVLLTGMIKGVTGSPMAQQTEFGWILSGATGQSSSNVVVLHTVSIDEQLKKFWELEELPEKRILTQEEESCEEHFSKTFTRNSEGRYIVRLPFKASFSQLSTMGNSRDRATARQQQLERKFLKNPDFELEYKKFMNEYIELGHMKAIPHENQKSVQSLQYYIPHHAVLKEASTTTRLRVVFDATAKTSSGTSLNNQLMVGPTIQQDLYTILLRWRKYKIGFTADVQKMYRQILVADEDCDVQRIVWRNSNSQPLCNYQLRTVTYGTASAPYLAVRTLQQLAIDYTHRYPIAAVRALRDFYVDDIMSGADSEDEALVLQKQLIDLLKAGCFDLRKWSSNSSNFLQNINLDWREISLPLEIYSDQSIKALGIHWHPADDTFHFKVQLNKPNVKSTKRSLLSESARLFDPIGWLAPTVLIAKLLFQQLWLHKLDWDDELPHNVLTKWNQFREELPLLEKIKISRWAGCRRSTLIELHGFCDASTKAYAAAVYARITHATGEINVVLLSAKTKVAPIKTISVPRLELCGAVLVANLLAKVRQSMEIENINMYAWTDSEIVLSWLQGHPSRWNTFVANRITQIIKILKPTDWYFVPTAQNPADCATRGLMPSELKSFSLWWNGPHWLTSDWTTAHPFTKLTSTNLEEKKVSVFTSTIKPAETFNMLEKYSSFTKLIRITAYCKRFIYNLRNTNRLTGILTPTEMNEALNIWIRLIQAAEYSSELKSLKSQKSIHNKSKLLSLSPFIDDANIIRVGGRLKHANISFDEKHPVILPPNNELTNLIIRKAHSDTLHGGLQLTTTQLRQTYWIVKARNAIKKQLQRCVICHRYRPKLQSQLMGNLPKARITMSRPFSHCGIDYAGPISTRPSKGRGIRSTKGYIALFVCFATKAIHIECVSDLTSESFLAAFRRFVSRRGRCAHLYSDNGTNFVGANKLIAKEGKLFANAFNLQVSEVLANQGTTWHFIPPASPHFGGLWEAGVKSVKGHLRRVIGENSLTYEELATTLSEIEACLNSRPLCQLTEDINDLSVLTPGHFLIGEPLLSPPQNNLLPLNVHHLRRWQLTTRLKQEFWKRWSLDHLNMLQQRPKWKTTEVQPKIGDLMLLKEDNLPPAKWKLVRILDLHPGSDSLVRVATVKTEDGITKRPIVKLSPLPIIDNDSIKPLSS